jgi:hypothetical protein
MVFPKKILMTTEEAKCPGQVTTVGTGTLRVRGSITDRGKEFSYFSKHPDRPLDPLKLLFEGNKGDFTGGKIDGA